MVGVDEEDEITCDSPTTEIQHTEKPKMGYRHALVILGFLGFINIYAMRVNLSVAIVAMVNQTEVNPGSKQFNWDSQTVGIILGSFFYGYITTQIIGGILAQKFGGKRVFTVGCFISSVITLVTPLAANLGASYLILARIVAGIGQGVLFPSMNQLLSKWSPKMETSKLSAMTYTGTMVGTVLSLSLSGLLCQSAYFGGWPLAFYLFGITSLIWLLFWHFLIFESPNDHPYITITEKRHISTNTISRANQTESIPWKHIASSPAVWGIIIAHMGQNWGFYTLLTEMPSFMSSVLHFSLSQNSFLSALPYLLMWMVSLTSSYIADRLRESHTLTTENTRKLFNCIGTFVPATALIGVTLSGTNPKLVVAFLCIAVGINGASMSGYNVNHIDIAPNYAGVLMGITNTMATIPGIVSPYIVGLVVGDEPSAVAWHTVFELSAIIYVTSALTFVILGSGSPQPWNSPTPEHQYKD